MTITTAIVSFFDEEALVLVVGLCLLVCAVIIAYHSQRTSKAKAREESTRLMIGAYDLYAPEDRERVNALINDLYQMYADSYASCGLHIKQTDELFDWFVLEFAYPYIVGRLDLTSMPEEVATRFRELHYEYTKVKPIAA